MIVLQHTVAPVEERIEVGKEIFCRIIPSLVPLHNVDDFRLVVSTVVGRVNRKGPKKCDRLNMYQHIAHVEDDI